MTIWIITYSDGFTFSGKFTEAYDNEQDVTSRAAYLQAKDPTAIYSVMAYALNTRTKHW